MWQNRKVNGLRGCLALSTSWTEKLMFSLYGHNGSYATFVTTLVPKKEAVIDDLQKAVDVSNVETEKFHCVGKLHPRLEFDANKTFQKVGTGSCSPLCCIASSFNDQLL